MNSRWLHRGLRRQARLKKEAEMTIKITPNDRCNPPGKLADAELHFTPPGPDDRGAIWANDGELLGGLKLIGFGVWEIRGKRTVTFPARQYSVNGERRSFALLRPIVDITAQNPLRDAILAAYADWEQAGGGQ